MSDLKNIHQVIADIQKEINFVFNRLNHFLLGEEDLKNKSQTRESWTIHQILEHISLTNHYLLKLIQKGSKKALRKREKMDLEKELAGYDFNKPNLDAIADSESFRWKSPEHMVPMGASMDEISGRFKFQLKILNEILETLKNGEGILQKTTMNVYQLGKLDVYQYIQFLLLHAKRHIEQMEKIEET